MKYQATIKLYNIPNEVKEEDLPEYFENYIKEFGIIKEQIKEIKMETYTEKEQEAMDKAKKILTKAELYIEANEDMPDSDELERWCIHPKEE